MINHPNIVEKFYYEELIVLKFKNPNFSLFKRLVAPTAPVPLPLTSEINPSKHINKTVFVIPFSPRYMHMLIEGLSLVLELKEKVGLTDLVITAPMPLDPETGLFVHFTKKYEYPYFDQKNIEHFNIECLDGIKSNFSTIPDFCEYFGINLICIPEHEFVGTSFDYAYFAYAEHYSPNTDEFIFMDDSYKEIDAPKSLVPIKIHEEYGAVLPSLESKKYTGYHMLLTVKSRKNTYSSFKVLIDNYPKFDVIPGKKIYVSRKNSPHRNVIEEEQIEEYFKKFNYEIVYFENLTILQQSQICQESEKIACLYGSNLLNCGFCSDKTTVISIKYKIPPNHCTINGLYNYSFCKNSIKHVELEYNGDDLLGFIKDQKDLW